ncbi:ABC1 kinase family protein [Desulfuribacillus alkaliarsenatis]|uniref:ABC transporter n=1 Tax=Desulfuribacillus alkaliarsenatis TaxID=766136 RepID=A0A1E5G030_9FIRM|nr:AarF/ABC1/UbiB kinase family protein [Desulfuribacillus alkaliarsenatis]OEF96059.1 ABC transporter [Desulfuribacillus alkaliarsenatis]
MFKTRYRHISRYRKIVNTLAKHGFGFLIDQTRIIDLFGKDKHQEVLTSKIHAKKSRGERIRLVCEELGPTFIKLGQIASTRHDIFPEDIISELENLQDNVSSFSYTEVKKIIESELLQPIENIFLSVETEPIATASIGQVHKARLKSGQPVAVKVQRPDITETIETDLDILFDIARISENRTEWGKQYHLYELVDEFAFSIRSELNYLQEARNTERIKSNLKNTDYPIYIPEVIWDYTTKKVITLEYLDGEKLTKTTDKFINTDDKELIATTMIEAMFHMILNDGIFHADPHPGNMLLLENNSIGLLDFGMVGKASKSIQESFINILIGLMRKNTGTIVKAIHSIGIVPDGTDIKRFHQDIDVLRDKYYYVPFSEIHLGEAIKDLFAVTRKHGILVPTEFLLLAKALITLEGLVETLAPKLNIVQIAEPMGKKYLKTQYSPENLLRRFTEEAKDYSEILLDIPRLTKDLLQKTKEGKTNIEITVPKLDLFLRKLDTISNRLSFAIIMLSFSIIMVGLIVGSSLNRHQTVLWDVPAIEIGFIVATFMFLWLLISIFRSGRF